MLKPSERFSSESREEIDVVFQTDALAGFDQVFAADAAEIRVMQNQVRKFGALLNQMDVGQAFHLVVKPVKADKFAENDSRVVEAECLVKIAGQKILLHHGWLLLFFLPAKCRREPDWRPGNSPHNLHVTLLSRGQPHE